MKGLLADVNVQGHVDALVDLMQTEPWKLFWQYLDLQYFHFADIGLPVDAADSVVWDTCQAAELILITDNRNRGDSTSLEATIQARNLPSSLPVFTIANIPQLRASKEYAERVVEKLLDALLRIDNLRGTGRLYLP